MSGMFSGGPLQDIGMGLIPLIAGDGPGKGQPPLARITDAIGGPPATALNGAIAQHLASSSVGGAPQIAPPTNAVYNMAQGAAQNPAAAGAGGTQLQMLSNFLRPGATQ